jgi:hypothetical protein
VHGARRYEKRLPLYAIALLLDIAGAAIGRLAAWLAGDAWP